MNRAIVVEALDNQKKRRVSDIRGPLSLNALEEYLQLWELLEDIHLQRYP
jgi:hypothetical protein